MKCIECYRTSDGVLHESYQSAKHHAEKLYGEQLSKMAHELVCIDKYSDMMSRLDCYKGSMQRLLDLSEDLVVEDAE